MLEQLLPLQQLPFATQGQLRQQQLPQQQQQTQMQSRRRQPLGQAEWATVPQMLFRLPSYQLR